MRNTSSNKGMAVLVVAATLAACSSQPPEWVINPKLEGGFAATECIVDSGNMSLDRQIVVAKSRAEISKQVELRVAAMDKTYTRLTEESPPPGGVAPRSLQTAFESVSKQISEQTLSGLAPERVEYIEWNDRRQLCAMITLPKPKGQEIFNSVMRAANVAPEGRVQQALYQEFTAPQNE